MFFQVRFFIDLQEKYYEQLKSIASSYSLHNKFVPVLLFDLPSPIVQTTDRLPDVVVFDEAKRTFIKPFGRRRRAGQATGPQHAFQSAIHPTSDPTLIVGTSEGKNIVASNGHQNVPKQGEFRFLSILCNHGQIPD